MKKAIFLDRDGVIITERGDFNYKEEHIEIVKGIAEALQKLRDAGFIFVVITNQSGVSKGIYSHKRVKEIHRTLKNFFSEYGVKILDFYYCPHHPSISNCICRKPDSGMLEKAMARFDVDPGKSWFIGDAERDILAGHKAGLKTLHITANEDLGKYVDLLIRNA